MTDVVFLAALIAVFWSIGQLPCRLLLPAGPVPGRALAAPGLGFGLFSIVATVLYHLNVPASGLFWLLVGLAAAGLLSVPWRRPAPSAETLMLIAAGFVVALLLLLPKWIGGLQFSIFQGNIWDQFGYLARTLSYRAFSHDQLIHIGGTAPLLNNFVDFARNELTGRPAVNIVHAAVAPLSAELLTLHAYVFMVFLQLLSFFALAFVVVAVTGRAMAVALGLAAALTLGFFLQYVFDINAWSQLAGMPLALMACALALIVVDTERQRVGDLPWRITGAFALTVAAVFYLYPEIAPIYLIPLAAVTGLTLLRPAVRPEAARHRLLLLAGAGMVALALTLPCWNGTLAFLGRQFATSLAQNVDWFLYFQRYLAPADLTEFFTTAYKTGHLSADGSWQAIVFMPIDLVTGLAGLYMLQPPVELPLVARVIWRLAVLGFLVALLVPALRLALAAAWRGDTRTGRLLRLALLTLLMPLPFVAIGRLWGAGKAIAMIGPFLFLLVVVPLLLPGQPRRRQLPALLFLAIQLGFGVARPFAAARPDGIHFALPYPSIQSPEYKIALRWDLGRWDHRLRSCRWIAVDTANPFLERYVQLHLTELGSVWWSVRPLNGYFDRGPVFGLQPPRGEPDCVITDRPLTVASPDSQTTTPAATVISLARPGV